MSKFEQYLEAVKNVVEASGKGTKEIMDLIKSGKAHPKTNGIQHHSDDITQGAVVAFISSMYPNADIDELKDEYESYIKEVMKKGLGPKPMKKDLMEIDDISLDFWPDDEANPEIKNGFDGFVWGVPDSMG